MMNVQLYRAVEEGQLDILVENRDILEVQLTPTKDTLLHIATLYGKKECVSTILTLSPFLVNETNEEGNTALHIAAIGGDLEMARLLVEHANSIDVDGQRVKRLLRETNKNGDTALHVTVGSSYCDIELVKFLMEEDAGFTHPANQAEETPLYLAAERGLDNCISQILRISSQEPSPYGPTGRTAFHAAAIFGSQGSIRELLKMKQCQLLSKEVDNYGWTAPHYAARFGHFDCILELIESDNKLAYLPTLDDGDNENTVLHLAATHGHVNIIEQLILLCPDCSEMVNIRGENIFHVAAKNQNVEVIKFILNDPFLPRLINCKDNNGDTPLHILAASPCFNSLRKKLLTHPRAKTVMMTFNSENKTPFDVYNHGDTQDRETFLASIQFKDIGVKGWRNTVRNDKAKVETKKTRSIKWQKEGVEKSKLDAERNLLASVMVATVAFAAAFTLPGGYYSSDGSNQGMAILARNSAFKAFLVFDTLAMMFSSTAVFFYYSISVRDTLQSEYEEDASAFMSASRVAMLMAFVTGIYATLRHEIAVAAIICTIGCIGFYIPFFIRSE